MIAKVTGHENSSAWIIASWFALLKSDHRAEEPVGYTSIPSPESAVNRSFTSSTALTISSVVPFAPAMTMPVRPSGLIVIPGCGATTSPNLESPANTSDTSAITS